MAIKLHGSQIFFCSILTNDIIKYIKKQKMRKLPASSVQGCSEEWLWRNWRVPLLCCQSFSSTPHNREKTPDDFAGFAFRCDMFNCSSLNLLTIQKLCSCCHDMWRDPLFFALFTLQSRIQIHHYQISFSFSFFFFLSIYCSLSLDIYVTHGDSCTKPIVDEHMTKFYNLL